VAPDKDKKVDLIVVVSGEPIEVDVNPNQKAEQIVREALRRSGNQGRPIEEWELKREDGSLIELTARVGDLGLIDGMRLFLSPKAGGGGG
jgi:hypothetical protein